MAYSIPETAAERARLQQAWELEEQRKEAVAQREAEAEARNETFGGDQFRASDGTEADLNGAYPTVRTAKSERNIGKMIRGLQHSDYLRKASDTPLTTKEAADQAHRQEQLLYMSVTNPRGAAEWIRSRGG